MKDLDRNDFVRALVLLYEDPERARTAFDGDTFAAGVLAACRMIQAEVMPASCGPNGWQRNSAAGSGYDIGDAFLATIGDGNRHRAAMRSGS